MKIVRYVCLALFGAVTCKNMIQNRQQYKKKTSQSGNFQEFQHDCWEQPFPEGT